MLAVTDFLFALKMLVSSLFVSIPIALLSTFGPPLYHPFQMLSLCLQYIAGYSESYQERAAGSAWCYISTVMGQVFATAGIGWNAAIIIDLLLLICKQYTSGRSICTAYVYIIWMYLYNIHSIHSSLHYLYIYIRFSAQFSHYGTARTEAPSEPFTRRICSYGEYLSHVSSYTL
jgi:hypothetical protein